MKRKPFDPDNEPTAGTAGEQDHTDPWEHAGDDEAEAPTELGKPPADETDDQPDPDEEQD